MSLDRRKHSRREHEEEEEEGEQDSTSPLGSSATQEGGRSIKGESAQWYSSTATYYFPNTSSSATSAPVHSNGEANEEGLVQRQLANEVQGGTPKGLCEECAAAHLNSTKCMGYPCTRCVRLKRECRIENRKRPGVKADPEKKKSRNKSRRPRAPGASPPPAPALVSPYEQRVHATLQWYFDKYGRKSDRLWVRWYAERLHSLQKRLETLANGSGVASAPPPSRSFVPYVADTASTGPLLTLQLCTAGFEWMYTFSKDLLGVLETSVETLNSDITWTRRDDGILPYGADLLAWVLGYEDELRTYLDNVEALSDLETGLGTKKHFNMGATLRNPHFNHAGGCFTLHVTFVEFMEDYRLKRSFELWAEPSGHRARQREPHATLAATSTEPLQSREMVTDPTNVFYESILLALQLNESSADNAPQDSDVYRYDQQRDSF